MVDAYAAIAPFYDLEFADFDADVDLYLGYAGVVGSPILELGCGTGRLLVPLASAGYQVSGLDVSPAMIAIARERLEGSGLARVELDVGNITDLSVYPSAHFRLVFAAINSFLHLESREDQLAALQEVRRVLHEDGILVLDVFHPTPAVLQALDDQLRLDGQWGLPDGARLDRLSHRRLHVAAQRIDTTLYYDRTNAAGTLSRTVAEYATRYIHRFEMESLLSEAGYGIEGVYGSYQLDPLDDSSAVMVFVAHGRPDGDGLL
ncbi:MAG TPA: class I SAM-dependent methyltransferase [Thermomicrobiaceae bacterium]|nr:class I SAM-dependent methyltransferase [Thermomicrobiaceae bacterium]